MQCSSEDNNSNVTDKGEQGSDGCAKRTGSSIGGGAPFTPIKVAQLAGIEFYNFLFKKGLLKVLYPEVEVPQKLYLTIYQRLFHNVSGLEYASDAVDYIFLTD